MYCGTCIYTYTNTSIFAYNYAYLHTDTPLFCQHIQEHGNDCNCMYACVYEYIHMHFTVCTSTYWYVSTLYYQHTYIFKLLPRSLLKIWIEPHFSMHPYRYTSTRNALHVSLRHKTAGVRLPCSVFHLHENTALYLPRSQ